MYRASSLLFHTDIYLPGLWCHTTRAIPEFAAKETRLLGTTTHIRQHPHYKDYVKYALHYLDGKVKHLPFIPQSIDKSYLDLSPLSITSSDVFLQSIVQTDSNCLHIICLHPWMENSNAALKNVTFDGDILRIAHSLVLFCTQYLRHSKYIVTSSLKLLVSSLRKHNPEVYEEIRKSCKNFPVYDYLDQYEYPPNNVMTILSNIDFGMW